MFPGGSHVVNLGSWEEDGSGESGEPQSRRISLPEGIVPSDNGDHNNDPPRGAVDTEEEESSENEAPTGAERAANGHSNHNNNNNGNSNNAGELLRSNPDVRLLIKILGRYFPFLLVLFMKVQDGSNILYPSCGSLQYSPILYYFVFAVHV